MQILRHYTPLKKSEEVNSTFPNVGQVCVCSHARSWTHHLTPKAIVERMIKNKCLPEKKLAIDIFLGEGGTQACQNVCKTVLGFISVLGLKKQQGLQRRQTDPPDNCSSPLLASWGLEQFTHYKGSRNTLISPGRGDKRVKGR